MLRQILEYIAPPQFADDDKNQGVVILNAILLSTIAILITAVLMVIIFTPSLWYSIFIYSMAIVILCLFYVLFRRGNVQLVRYGLVGTFWALITAGVTINGGLTGPVFNAYLTLIILAALILGPRGGITIAIINGISATILFWLDEAGLLVTPRSEALEPLHLLIINLSLFTIGSMFLYIAMRTINNTYRKVRQNEASLRRALEDLQATTVSKDYVNNIIQSMSNMLIVLDRNGIIRTVNQRTVDVLGYSESDLVGKPYNAMILDPNEDDPERMSATILRRIQLVRNVEQMYQTRDGRRIPVSVSSSVMYNADNQVEGIVCVAQDVTDLRKAERERKQTQAQLEHQASLLNAVSDAIISTEMDMTITSWNKAAELVYGYTSPEVIGRNLMDVIPTRFDSDSQDNLIKQQYLDRGHWQNEVIQRRKDGKEINILSSIALLRDGEGKPAGTVTINHDITKRKQAEIRLQQRAEELATLRQVDIEIGSTLEVDEVLQIGLKAAVDLSGASAGFVMLADEGRFQVLFRQGAYQSNQTLQQGIVLRIIETQQPEFIPDVSQDGDYIAHLPDTIALMLIPLIYQERMIGLINLETNQRDSFNDEIFGLMQILAARVAIALDNARLYEVLQQQLIELQELYIQVSKLEELKTDMIRLASHDLRSPVGIAKGNLQLLRGDIETDLNNEQIDFIVQIDKALNRMNDIATNILSLDRIHNTVHQDFTEAVDLPALVERAVAQYKPSADHAGINMSYAILPSHEPIHVLGDDSELYEAMANLINNAIKYTPTGGEIEITLRQNGSKAAFTVKDTGYGVPKDQHNLLFQPMSRINTEETREIEGVGLGLHLVRNIVERHRGKIIFESVYRQGSTFGFELPILPEV